MKAIRIEHNNGIGIFRNEEYEKASRTGILKEAIQKHFDWGSPNEFPCPEEDNLDLWKDDKEWFCAFRTIKQLQGLFTKNELKEIDTAGYSINMIEISEYQKSKHQILYTKESISSTEKINSLFL
jgi:hypothetical protein